jgi:hypothetical protein
MKIMQFIKQLIFGVRREPVDNISTGFHSSYPKNPPSLDEWVKEFKFGSRYGHRGTFYQN